MESKQSQIGILHLSRDTGRGGPGQERASGYKQERNTNKIILRKKFLPTPCLETLCENMSDIWAVWRKGMNTCTARHGRLGKGTSSERERGNAGRGDIPKMFIGDKKEETKI